MATTPRFGKPYIFVTWITGVLSGDRSCVYAPWLKAHFKYDKQPDENFNLAAWTADHTALVARRKAELETDGWTVTIEGQNDVRLKGNTALLAGKPDLIAVRGVEALVSDAKTGKQRHSDWFQILIYLFALPHVRPELVNGRRVSGEVVYRDHVIAVEPEELTETRREEIATMLRTIGSDERPAPVPSRNECRMCDIADCASRFVEIDEPAETTAF